MLSKYTGLDFLTLYRLGISGQLLGPISRKETGLLRAVSRARIFPSLVKELGWLVNDQDCGTSMPASLSSYDRDTQSWRTLELSLFEDSTPSLDRLPKSGMMRNGKIYALPMSERRTDGKESGLWRTPAAHEPGVKAERLVPIEGGEPGGMNRHFDKNTGRMAQIGLPQQVALREQWSTPTANDAKNSLTDSQRGRGTLTANLVERLWPTPRTAGMCGGTGNWNQLKDKCESIEEARKMGAGNGGQLNPTWVEWLMGYPLGWTDLNVSATR